MTVFSSRPLDMVCRDNVYYPMGLPTEENPKTHYFVDYKDEDYISFWICYTEEQLKEASKSELFVFCPFIPISWTALSKPWKEKE